jgi:hypothetical protein
VGKHSKQKGAENERKLCVSLSLWVSGGERQDLFWRSAMSGGRATVSMKNPSKAKLYSQAGDISAIDPAGAPLIDLFFVECKHLQSLELERMIWQKEGKAPEIWDLPYTEAKKYGKEPLVLARQDRQKTLVLTTARGGNLLRLGGKLRPYARVKRVLPDGTPTQMYIYSHVEMVTQIKWPLLLENARHGKHLSDG